MRAEFKGFKVFERKNILVEVGKDVRIDAVLSPGSTNETITITEEVPMVDTTSTTLGGTISNEIINDLPLNGAALGPRPPTAFGLKTPVFLSTVSPMTKPSWALA